MKRSEINNTIKFSLAFLKQLKFNLPPFAYWTAEQWNSHPENCEEIKDAMLGWDVTDFGYGEILGSMALPALRCVTGCCTTTVTKSHMRKRS